MTEDPLSPFRLDGRVAVVTGASSGIGFRLARVLHDAGARVVAAARRRDRLDRLTKELERATAVACDVADDAQCRHLIDTTLELYGRIDVLVNNAGVTVVNPAETETPETFRRVLDVNLTGAFVLGQLAGKHMLEAGRGSIVNITSILGLVGVGQIPMGSYAAGKGGLVNLTRELAAQWARRGVRVNAVAPGWFPTEMTADMFATDEGRRWVRSRTPMGRPGMEHELDGAVLFLASDASSYVTGQVLAVDGGWTAV
ncbi:MAG TPA: glucose 1-dehydrogenase [Acidimicrobiia bacterium]|nr:glucose 1-dehydrogenase [Acidimicrobiia bacterium]